MFATFHAPDFMLQVARRVALEAQKLRVPDLVALIDGEHGGSGGRKAGSSDKGWIVEADAGALAQGVEIGMTASQAYARHAGLVLLRRDIEAENCAVTEMLAFAEKLSPRFEATSPGVVTLDLRAVTLPATPAALRSYALDVLGQAREQCALGDLLLGLADGPEAAMLAALRADPVCVSLPSAATGGGGSSRVAELPLSSLAPDPGVAGILSDWGIVTVAQLVALPRDEVVRRLGTVGARLWDDAAGKGGRLLDLERGKKRYLRVKELEYPLDALEPLLFLLRRMLEELLAEIAGDYLVVVRMLLVLGFADGRRRREEIKLPAASCDLELLHRVLHTRLDGVEAKAPLEKLALKLFPARPTASQQGLFGRGVRDPHQLAETLAQIEALLGRDGLAGSPQPLDGYRSDAFVMQPFTPVDIPAIGSAAEEVRLMDADAALFQGDTNQKPKWGLPLRRLRPPERIDVVENRGADKGAGVVSLLEIRSGRFCGRIGACLGPWIFSGDWWGQEAWQREEWDVELETGGLLRISRDGKGKWQLEGIYG